MGSPAARRCPTCLHAPCLCPDVADESDEQAAEEENAYVRRLLADFERAS